MSAPRKPPPTKQPPQPWTPEGWASCDGAHKQFVLEQLARSRAISPEALTLVGAILYPLLPSNAVPQIHKVP
jgi:hypothetical protein